MILGNSAYRHAPSLPNPVNDAKAMADSLRAAGFELVGGAPQIDLDRAATERAIRSFGGKLAGADVGLFFYAGHGMQARGTNYLLPVSANLEKESDVRYELIDIAMVLDEMALAESRMNIVILDACRNNPFGGRGLRAASPGLAQMQAPAGTIIAYATQPGAVAADGTGSNSPYTEALSKALLKPGETVFDVFNDVGITVKRNTGGVQQPWVSASPIEGRFYFLGRRRW
nr:caspase family protein [Azospirillum sp. INR13]